MSMSDVSRLAVLQIIASKVLIPIVLLSWDSIERNNSFLFPQHLHVDRRKQINVCRSSLVLWYTFCHVFHRNNLYANEEFEIYFWCLWCFTVLFELSFQTSVRLFFCRWSNGVETCRSVIIYKLIVIVLLLVILQNNNKCTVHVLNKTMRYTAHV
jgi:hypothetical protein